MNFIEVSKEYGPVLSIVGSVMTVVFAIIGFLVKQMWAHHSQKMESLILATQELATNLKEHENSTLTKTYEFESILQGFRAELHLTSTKFENIRGGFLSCEANINAQQKTITEHIRELAKIDSKLDAVFRFIDAKARMTDVSR